MKDRHVLLAVVGILSTYVVIHAGMSGFALYLIDDALRRPVFIDGPYMDGSRAPFVTLFLIMVVLGGLSVAAFVAFWRNATYARSLWLAFSLILLVCLAVAVFVFQATWGTYVFEVGMMFISWLYLRRAERDEHAG